ncbi:hypothetical protein KP509_28G064800 [Ceratopteris richardii]|uniref:RING-CH-type domain-containing protein n=1 Tax=Ceratopteris richardii TaxID=49495 RepID=A0A8T2REX8_CERRI|nr:hypothetical protein KP509_28G064800 [Ceratopteris richardii]
MSSTHGCKVSHSTTDGQCDILPRRSLSFPSFRRWRSSFRQKSNVLIIRSVSFGGVRDASMDGTRFDMHSGDTEVSEDEAVCRICMLELEEGRETFKMECSCKGELSLGHQDCIVKWFSVKGNNVCDICHTVVTNLPVLLLRRPSSVFCANTSAGENAEMISSWRHTMGLLFSNALASLWHKLQELSEFP